MATVQGTTNEKFRGVADVLAQQLENGEDLGASVCVIERGNVVVDIWGGWRDEAKTTPWTSDTLVNVWSTTKTMTFVVGLMLVDQGLLDFDERVAHYWPEFAANGKEDILVRHFFSHSSGLSGWDQPITGEDLGDWDDACARLARQAPWWDDRRQSGYHALTQGFLIGELVRRITGESFGTFFRKNVAEVLGADFYVGLPDSEESRVSLVVPPAPIDPASLANFPMAIKTFTSPLLDATMPHERWWRAAEVPAANGHGNAKSVALIQQIIANGGEANGHRFFSKETCDRVFVPQTSGVDLVLAQDTTFGMGYGLSSSTTPLGPRACYWGGYGGSVIIMDQDTGLTVSYMMNRMLAGVVGDSRGSALTMAAVMAALS